MNDVEQVITFLRSAGVPVEKQAYGFSLRHHEQAGGDFAQCGFDNDSSISLWVTLGETSPVHWFFRISFVEMAEFIAAAYQATKTPNASIGDIIKSMCALDRSYDDMNLEKMTAQFLAEVENDLVLSTNIVPKDKHDLKACKRLSIANDAEVIANLDALLGWTADVNWPVARHVIDRLKVLGDELVLPIKQILTSVDDTWKYFIIVHLVSALREDVFKALKTDLERIVSDPTKSEILEEVHLETKALLIKKRQI